MFRGSLDYRVSVGIADTSRSLKLEEQYIQNPSMKHEPNFDRMKFLSGANDWVPKSVLETADYISINIGPRSMEGASSVEKDGLLTKRIDNAIITTIS